MVEFDSCEALGNKKPKSVIVIDISFKSNVGLKGRFGSDQDGLANIGATTAAVGENKLGLGRATSSADMLKLKGRRDEKKGRDEQTEEGADADAGATFDPESAFDAALDPMAPSASVRPPAATLKSFTPAPTVSTLKSFTPTTVGTGPSGGTASTGGTRAKAGATKDTVSERTSVLLHRFVRFL